MIKVHNLQIVV